MLRGKQRILVIVSADGVEEGHQVGGERFLLTDQISLIVGAETGVPAEHLVEIVLPARRISDELPEVVAAHRRVQRPVGVPQQLRLPVVPGAAVAGFTHLHLPIAGIPARWVSHQGEGERLLLEADRTDQVLVGVLVADFLDPKAERVAQRRHDEGAPGLRKMAKQAIVIRQVQGHVSSLPWLPSMPAP